MRWVTPVISPSFALRRVLFSTKSHRSLAGADFAGRAACCMRAAGFCWGAFVIIALLVRVLAYVALVKKEQ
jgi:predicted aconitase with swiveling domain